MKSSPLFILMLLMATIGIWQSFEITRLKQALEESNYLSVKWRAESERWKAQAKEQLRTLEKLQTNVTQMLNPK